MLNSLEFCYLDAIAAITVAAFLIVLIVQQRNHKKRMRKLDK